MTVSSAGNNISNGNRLLSLDESAPFLPISRASLYLMAASGELPTIKSQIIGRPRLVKVSDLSSIFGSEFNFVEKPAPENVIETASVEKFTPVIQPEKAEKSPGIEVLEERVNHLEIRNQDLIEQNQFLKTQIEHSQSRMDKVVNLFENSFFETLFEQLKLMLPSVFQDNNVLGKNGFFSEQAKQQDAKNCQLKVV
jgi:hypothetical protein